MKPEKIKNVALAFAALSWLDSGFDSDQGSLSVAVSWIDG